MSITNAGEIQGEVLVRNNRTTTDSFITDTILQDWLRDAHQWASSFHKWPFTEGKATTTFAASSDGMAYFEGWKTDSIRLLQIGGKRVDKKNFYEYQRFIEDNSSATDRIYSDFARVVYVNPLIDLSGTLTAWGQYAPIIDPTDLTATTIFSGYEEDGNEAIVEKMSSYLKRREHQPDEAELHDQRAAGKLEELWKRIQDEQYGYQTTDGDGMFKRMDVLNGGFRDDIFNRDQFN